MLPPLSSFESSSKACRIDDTGVVFVDRACKMDRLLTRRMSSSGSCGLERERSDECNKSNNMIPNQRLAKKPKKASPGFDWFVIFYIFWSVFMLLIIRKTFNATGAMKYVRKYAHQVSQHSIENSENFAQLLSTLDSFDRPPAIFMLNQFALKMTNNFLCNTANMPGVHERLVFVTLDSTASDSLRRQWPNIKQLKWPTPCLYERFNFAEGAYQIIYLLRANLAASLTKHGKSFWMMQQDTFWRKNLFDLNMEDGKFDLLFDQIGDDVNSKRAEWINGANFFVRANNRTLVFFERMAYKLEKWYIPDMGIMIHQCQIWDDIECTYIPHSIGHSWEWMYTGQRNPPYIMQLDCETQAKSKLDQLAKYGFYFMADDGQTCNQTAVDMARYRMETGTVPVKLGRLSWGRIQFKAYWLIADTLISLPVLGAFIKPYMCLIGYVLMITI